MEYYPELELDQVTAQALDELLGHYVSCVMTVLEAAAIDEQICSLCLSPGQEQEVEMLPVIYAGRATDRDRMLRDGIGNWQDAWNPYAFRDEEDVVHPIYEADDDETYVEFGPRAISAWRRVRDALSGRCLSPEYWVHARAARQLNRVTLPLPVTDDFAVWVFDFDAGPDEMNEMFRSVLPAASYSKLAGSGLIGTVAP